jgi:decaprenyl-phosphate phosphoribosyltransferase
MFPRALFKTLRPHQWVKNLFVLVPLVFAKKLLAPDSILTALGALGLFCLASGVVYLINDLVDVEQDRVHPVKRHRPIAAGDLSVGGARLAAALLGPGVLLAGYQLSTPLGLVLAGYITLNLFYSIVLKHLPYLDVLSIAAGFLLRVLGGALALGVPASIWLLVCTALLACYLGLGKRAHELVSLGDNARHARAVLARYDLKQIKIVMLTLAVATLTAYVLYTVSAETRAAFSTRYLAATGPFTFMGLLRYYQLVTHPHRESSPTDEMLRDWPFIGNLALWGATVVVVIYVLPG